jgi:hypothetical protein
MTDPTTEPSEEALALAREVVTGWHDSGYCEELIIDVARALNRFRAAGVREWQPIETAPKDGMPGSSSRWLLLFGDGPGFMQCHFVGFWGIRETGYDECWRCSFYPYRPARPTHWVPLPEAPHD